MSDTERILIETIQAIESVNLTELLPLEAMAWYEQRQLEEELSEESERVRLARLESKTD